MSSSYLPTPSRSSTRDFISPSPKAPTPVAAQRLLFTSESASRPNEDPDDPPSTVISALFPQHQQHTPVSSAAASSPSFVSPSHASWSLHVMLLARNDNEAVATLADTDSKRKLMLRTSTPGSASAARDEEVAKKKLVAEVDEIEFDVDHFVEKSAVPPVSTTLRRLDAHSSVLDLKEAIAQACAVRPLNVDSFSLVFQGRVLPDWPSMTPPTLRDLGLFSQCLVYCVESTAEQYALRETLATRLVSSWANRKQLLSKANSIADSLLDSARKFEELVEEDAYPMSPKNRNVQLTKRVRDQMSAVLD